MALTERILTLTFLLTITSLYQVNIITFTALGLQPWFFQPQVLYIKHNQAMECAIPYTVGQSQAKVNWKGCGRNGIRCKILGWDSLSSLSCLCGCCKPVSSHTVRGKSGRVPVTNKRPLKSRTGKSFWVPPACPSCLGKRATIHIKYYRESEPQCMAQILARWPRNVRRVRICIRPIGSTLLAACESEVSAVAFRASWKQHSNIKLK